MACRMALAGICLALATSAQATGIVAQTFTHEGLSSNASLGASVVSLGGRIAIGAPATSSIGCLQHGAVYVFDAASGAPLVDIVPSTGDGCLGDLGSALAAIDGDILASAPRRASGGLAHGEVYRFDGTTGALEQTFSHPSPPTLGPAGFGTAIAAGDGDVLVGAPSGAELSAGSEVVAAGVVFRFDGTTGSLLGSYANPTPSPSDAFGESLAVRDGLLFVAAPGAESSAGAVFAFDLTSGQHLWTATNPDPEAIDSFARSLAAAPGAVAVGDPLAGNGRVHVFDPSTGAYLRSLESPEPNPASSSGAAFGRSLSAFADGLLVGAPSTRVGGSPSQGAAYFFDTASGALRSRFHAPALDFGLGFGRAIAGADGRVLVGAPGLDAFTFGDGGAFLFETCLSLGEGAACDDGNGCDTGDVCQGGACTAGTPVTCGAPPECRVQGCEPATGVCNSLAAPDGTLCFLGGPQTCSVGDACIGGNCFRNFDLPPPNQRDSDFDGVCTSDDLCPTAFDPAQKDADSDSAGDVCDANDALLVVHSTVLRANRAGRPASGQIAVRGELLSRADQTPFNPDAGLIAQIADAASFIELFSWPAEQCTGSGRLRCERTGRPSARVSFRPLQQRTDGLVVYKFTLKLAGVDVAGEIVPPVRVTLTTQPAEPVVGVDRAGAVAGCRDGRRRFSCRVTVSPGSASEAFLEAPETLAD